MENTWRTSKEKYEGDDQTKSAYERDEKEIGARSTEQQQAQEAAAALPDDLSAIPVPTEQEMHPAWLKAQEALRSIGGKTGQQQQEDTSGDAVVHHQQQSYEAAAAAVYGWPPNVGHQFSPYYQQQQPQHTMYDEQYQRQPPPQQYHHPQQQHRQQYRPRMMTGVYSNSTSSRPVPLAQVSVSGLHQSASPRFTKPIRFPSAQQHHQPPDSEVSTESQKFLGEAAGIRQYPVSLRSYIERAYRACEGAEEREKLENYLRQRVEPLLKSGAIYAVNWSVCLSPVPMDVVYHRQQQDGMCQHEDEEHRVLDTEEGPIEARAVDNARLKVEITEQCRIQESSFVTPGIFRRRKTGRQVRPDGAKEDKENGETPFHWSIDQLAKIRPVEFDESEELALPPEDWDPSAEFSRSQLTNVEHFWTRNTFIAPSPEVLPASDKIIVLMSPLLSPSRVLLAKLGKSGLQQHNHCALLSRSKRLGASESDKIEQARSREGKLRTRRATI